MDELLVEEFPTADEPGLTYAFHAPLNRAACEALGRATAARLGRRFGRDLALQAADLGWSIRLPGRGPRSTGRGLRLAPGARPSRRRRARGPRPGRPPRPAVPVHRGHGLHGPAQPRARPAGAVGGLNWVSTRLYPLVKAACPHHPLLRETRREVLQDLLDVPAAVRWLAFATGSGSRRLPRASRRSPRPGSRRLRG